MIFSATFKNGSSIALRIGKGKTLSLRQIAYDGREYGHGIWLQDHTISSSILKRTAEILLEKYKELHANCFPATQLASETFLNALYTAYYH